MTTKKKTKPTTDALEILDRLFYDGRPARQAALEVARQESDVAGKVYNMRKEADLTQKQLARLVGTAPSVISRLEDADYGKQSLSMLRRIATKLGRTVEVEFPEVSQDSNKWSPSLTTTGSQFPTFTTNEFVKTQANQFVETKVEDLSMVA